MNHKFCLTGTYNRSITGSRPEEVGMYLCLQDQPSERQVAFESFLIEHRRNLEEAVTDHASSLKEVNAFHRMERLRIEANKNMEKKKLNDLKEESLETRRQKLHDLLSQEAKDLSEEIKRNFSHKNEDCHQRLKYLKDQIENERLEYVKMQNERRFREQNTELKDVERKLIQEELNKDRFQQILQKEELKKRQGTLDKLYDQKLKEVCDAKRIKEEEQVMKRKEESVKNREILRNQIDEQNKTKMKKDILKEFQMNAMEKERSFIQHESRREHNNKLQAQNRRKLEIDKDIRNKSLYKQKQEKEANAYLDQDFMISPKNQVSSLEKKRQMMREQSTYQDFIFQQKEILKEEEKEIDKIVCLENKVMWEKRDTEAKRWDTARDNLRQNAVSNWYESIKDKKEREEEEKENNKLYSHQKIRVSDLLIQENLEKYNKNQAYKKELLEQIAQNETARQKALEIRDKERRGYGEEDKEYLSKLEGEKSKTGISNIHPRKKYSF